MSSFTDSTGMTIEICVNYCNNLHHIFAGLENGEDCCECTSRRSVRERPVVYVVFILRFGCQIVEMP